MPSKGDTQINTFVGGLITEASPLSFPPNASFDEVNFKLKRDGSRERRLGIDYEDSFSLIDSGFTAAQLQEARQRFFRWPNPSGSRDVEIGVVQIGNKLWFLNLFTENPSANLLNGGAPIEDSTLSLGIVFDFALINNNLLVVSEELYTPYLLSYDEDTDVVSYDTAFLNIRDLYGIDDGLSVDERPTSLTPNHTYNLRNQGWSENIITTCDSEILECTFVELGVYPSNADLWTLGKVADVSSADHDKYDPNALVKNSFDLGRAPRGHYIIDLYNRGGSRTEVSTQHVSNADRELGRVSTVATYAGRGFYSGIRSRVLDGDNFSPKNGGVVLFSQVVRSNIDLIKCYQEADPTSPEQSDIVDTDGGVIQISGATNIVKLLAVKTSLFVFAENGVWEIRGDDGGFRATSFQVNKVSSIGVFSRESIVEANGTIMFWAKEGIFALTPDQFGTSFDSTNLTITTIQKLYDSLPNLVKQGARGYYDVSANTVRWLYISDDEKIVGDPIDIQDPLPAILELGDIVEGETASKLDTVALTSSKYLIIYTSSGTTIKGVVVDVSGTTPTIGLANTLVSGFYAQPSVERLSDTKAIIGFVDGATQKIFQGAILDVSGTTITAGAATTLVTDSTSSETKNIAVISSTKVVIGYQNGAASSRQEANILAISGVTIIPSTPVIVNSTSPTEQYISVVNSTLVLASYKQGSVHKARTLNVSGTTLTTNAEIGTDLSLQSSTGHKHTFVVGSLYVISTEAVAGYNSAVINVSAAGAVTEISDTVTSDTSNLISDMDLTFADGNRYVNFYNTSTGTDSFILDVSILASGDLTSTTSHLIQEASGATPRITGLTGTKKALAWKNNLGGKINTRIIELGG